MLIHQHKLPFSQGKWIHSNMYAIICRSSQKCEDTLIYIKAQLFTYNPEFEFDLNYNIKRTVHFAYLSHMIMLECCFSFLNVHIRYRCQCHNSSWNLLQIRKYSNVKMSSSTKNFILRKDQFKPGGLLARQINNCLVKVFFCSFYGSVFYVWSNFMGLLSTFYELHLQSGKFQLWSYMSHLWPFVCWFQDQMLVRIVPSTEIDWENIHIQEDIQCANLLTWLTNNDGDVRILYFVNRTEMNRKPLLSLYILHTTKLEHCSWLVLERQTCNPRQWIN